jgi:phage terminase large subunit-like protein
VRVIVRGRQAGKTYALIEWVKEGDKTKSYPGWSRILLCHSLDEAQRIRTDPRYGLDYHQVFAVSEWRTARLGHKPVEIAMDNVDLVLASFIGQAPSQISITGSAD